MNTDSPTPPSRRISVVRQKAKDEQRRWIVNAAEEVFSESGYHDASLTMIARRAEIAVGTIYLYFRDKSDLYGCVLLERMTQMVKAFESALTSSESAAECLRRGIHAQFAFHDANRTFFEIFLHQHQVQQSPLHKEHWEEMEALKLHNLGVIEDCILRGQSRVELKPGSPRLLAVAYLGITLQMTRQFIRENTDALLIDSADFAADCFLYGAASLPQ
ncbi:DNA-binding transcriptional regulator, AcrR family [Terrimicrobium sacchariphilum]|uniref:DNA-binding transcriptional regulator, AcrR family n=1 Tax=Terrimicrobium sacchariphilum TaxID=690879 RepID=A0A146GD96_TERSA|nr:TetR/AcrR family transcriptional regulator [Terrimicrobium sacchariphilum]GAT35539.1 DNA-binding transcriptional regulator, AcrR family [Terrimicrobium sacchariphilum]